MTNNEKVKKTFEGYPIGIMFSRGEIIHLVKKKYAECDQGSIIPSDYCYNRINKGLIFEKGIQLFEYTNDKKYRYLGECYKYTGKIYHRSKSSKSDKMVGEWKNGEYHIDTPWVKK